MADPEIWSGDDAIITIEMEGKATVVNLQTRLQSIEVSGGTLKTDVYNCFGGISMLFRQTRDKVKVSMKFRDITQEFSAYAFSDGTATVGTEVKMTDAYKRARVMIWFQSKRYQKKNAAGTIVVPLKKYQLRRLIFCDCYNVELSRSVSTDSPWTGTISFEFGPVDGDGYSNFFDQYTSKQSTSALTVLSSTTSVASIEHKGQCNWSTTAITWTSQYRK